MKHRLDSWKNFKDKNVYVTINRETFEVKRFNFNMGKVLIFPIKKFYTSFLLWVKNID